MVQIMLCKQKFILVLILSRTENSMKKKIVFHTQNKKYQP